ncbi:MAG: hypothetical protein GY791_11680 [Alphaproteobacteria bacterium]|nr:hypothetical protein [Alphaproteobacteria bacterium]
MDETVSGTRALDALADKGAITEDDVRALRRDIFADGVADRREAELIFRIDRTVPAKHESWNAFYVEALTDHVVWKVEPKKYVSEENARFLIDNICADGRIDSGTELELLINVIHWARSCPEDLAVIALRAVRDSVLDPDTAAYGRGRRQGVIDAADVILIRKVIYADAGGGGFTVTRREAEILFDLNDATADADNGPEWCDLFVKAVASHLLFPRGAPLVPSAKEARRREQWIEQRRGIGRLLAGVGREVARLDPSETWRTADPFGTRRAEEDAKREADQLRGAMERENLDPGEARWLADRIGRDSRLHPNERALLAFIEQNAREIDPSLKPLLAEAVA